MIIKNNSNNNGINKKVDIRESTFRSLHKNTEVVEEIANGKYQINIISKN